MICFSSLNGLRITHLQSYHNSSFLVFIYMKDDDEKQAIPLVTNGHVKYKSVKSVDVQCKSIGWFLYVWSWEKKVSARNIYFS